MYTITITTHYSIHIAPTFNTIEHTNTTMAGWFQDSLKTGEIVVSDIVIKDKEN